MLEAAGWALLAASSLVLGAWLALTFDISHANVGKAMGFGAGALVGALAYELIPTPNVNDIWIWISFGAGSLVFYGVDGIVERRGAGGGSAGQTIALGALLDGIPESIVLGMSVAIGGTATVGFLTAVFVSNVPESLSSSAEMAAEHEPTRRIYRVWIIIAIASAIAGAFGYAVAHQFTGSDGRYIQAFAGGAVLTMLADSMFPEAYKEGGKPVALLTALGFAVAAVLTTFD